MSESYYYAADMIRRIFRFADLTYVYTDEELQKQYVDYQRLEKELIDQRNRNVYGDYSVDVVAIYYRIKDELRACLKRRGIL